MPTEIPIVASAKRALEVLLQSEGKKENHHEWLSLLKSRKEKYPFSYKRNSESIKPQYAIDMLYEITKAKSECLLDLTYRNPRRHRNEGVRGTAEKKR